MRKYYQLRWHDWVLAGLGYVVVAGIWIAPRLMDSWVSALIFSVAMVLSWLAEREDKKRLLEQKETD